MEVLLLALPHASDVSNGVEPAISGLLHLQGGCSVPSRFDVTACWHEAAEFEKGCHHIGFRSTRRESPRFAATNTSHSSRSALTQFRVWPSYWQLPRDSEASHGYGV